MSSERWLRGREIFERALELQPTERSAFLDSACGSHPALRRAVQSLLAADGEADDFLAQPLARLPGDSGGLAPGNEPQIGARDVGPYRVVRQLGEGGMGAVFLAVREDDLKRRVVIKLVRRGMESADLRRRLRTERQILASLDHPYVAKIFDGGTTRDGRPFFVMEYVEGEAIDTHCDLNRLTIDDRLTLFRKVCSAVHYAHQNLVVHRDLKPSNILVDGSGEPRLLDFGIAKLLNPELASPELEPTAAWLRLLTPHYASPEQVRGRLVTTVSDVYSLGVLLYQLLTGHLPHRFSGQSPQQIERVLTEQEPLLPSQIVESRRQRPAPEDRSDPASIVRARGARPGELRRALAGDLDCIVLKALRSAPQQRYGSVEQLAADIERYQRNLPVAARRGSWRYRAGKLVRRHRAAIIGGCVVGALLTAFAIGMAKQSARVAAERDQALVEKSKARNVLGLMLDVFRVADPYQGEGAGRELTVVQALERSLPKLDRRLGKMPLVRAEVLHAGGQIYRGLGIWDQAYLLLDEALQIRRAKLGDEHLEVAASAAALGAVLREQGEFEAAEKLLIQSLATARNLAGADDAIRVHHLNEIVFLYCYQRDYSRAEPLAREALELARKLPEDRSALLGAALGHLAATRYAAGDYREAAALLRQGITVQRGVLGEDHPELAQWLVNLGLALRRLEDLEAAAEAYREALQLQQQLLGPDHPHLMPTLGNLGGLEVARGALARALAAYSRASELARSHLGPSHWRTVFYSLRTEGVRIRQGEAAAAEARVRRLLERWRRERGDEHWVAAFGDGILGEALLAERRFDEAEAVLVRSFNTLLGHPQHRRRQEALDRLAALYRRTDRMPELEAFAQRLAAAAEAPG